MDDEEFSPGCKKDLDDIIALRVSDFRCACFRTHSATRAQARGPGPRRVGRKGRAPRCSRGSSAAGAGSPKRGRRRRRCRRSHAATAARFAAPPSPQPPTHPRNDSGMQEACEDDLESTCSTTADDLKDAKKRQTAINCLQAFKDELKSSACKEKVGGLWLGGRRGGGVGVGTGRESGMQGG